VGSGAEYATIADALTYVAANSDPVDVTSAAAQLLTATQALGDFNVNFSGSLYDVNDVCSIPFGDTTYLQLRNSGDTAWEPLIRPAQYSATNNRITCIAKREAATNSATAFRVVELPVFVIKLQAGVHTAGTATLPEVCHVEFIGEGRKLTSLEFTSAADQILTNSQGTLTFRGLTLTQANGQECIKYNAAYSTDPAEFLTLTIEECTVVPTGGANTAPYLDARCGLFYFLDSKVAAVNAGVDTTKVLCATFKISDCEFKSDVEMQVLSGLVSTSPSQKRIITASTFDTNLIIYNVSDRVDTVAASGSKWVGELNGCSVGTLTLGGNMNLRTSSLMVNSLNMSDNAEFVAASLTTSGGVYPSISVLDTSSLGNLTQLGGGGQMLFLSAAAVPVEGAANMIVSIGAFTVLIETDDLAAGQRFIVISNTANTMTLRTDTDLIAGATGGQSGTRMVLTDGGVADAFAMAINDAVEFLVVENTPGDPVYLLETNRFNTGLN